MIMKRALRVRTVGRDRIAEELMITLVMRKWFEFKPLFLLIHGALRERRAAHGGEEMLRLRVYDKLQEMVTEGLVEKAGKLYRGRLAPLAARMEYLATLHCRSLINVAGPSG